jgi:hypothetical protein
MEVTDVYMALHHETAENTFFSTPCGTFFKIDHILEHKASLNKHTKLNN